MLTPVRLDDEAVPSASEIDDERADQVRPSELIASEMSSTRSGPQPLFGIRRVLPKVAGKLVWHVVPPLAISSRRTNDRSCGRTLTRLAALATLSRGAGEGPAIRLSALGS